MGVYRAPYTQTHAHTSRWHEGVHSWLAVLTLSWRQIWLAGFTSASSLSCPSTPTCILLLNTVKFSAARPVTAVERQPVLSVLSALAFSWLGEMPVSILHQYPFIAITVVFSWLTEKTHRGESNRKKMACKFLVKFTLYSSIKTMNTCRHSLQILIVVSF